MKSLVVLVFIATLLQSVLSDNTFLVDPSYEGETWVVLNNSFRIVCKIPMREPFALEWTKDSLPLNITMQNEADYWVVDDFLESESVLMSVLSVRLAQTFHAGYYRCNRFSSHGHQIFIIGSDEKPITFEIGQPVLILNCTLPTDKVNWFKNGTLVEPKKDVEITSSNGSSSLVFTKPKVGDIGMYSCSEQGRSDQSENIRVAMEPYVADFTKSASVVEDDKLRLPCTVYGYPTPTVVWKKRQITEDEALTEATNSNDWEDIMNNDHYSFDTNEGVPLATLVINNTNSADRADYMCAASNDLGSANKTVLVRVIDKYAALWPFLGICVEVVVLCTVILIFERRRTKKQLEDSDNEQQHNSKHVSNAKDSEVRNRK